MQSCRKGNKKKRDQFDIAQRRIGHHLDIVNFINEQMQMKVMRHLIFTKFENFLLKRQRMPFVLETKEPETSSCDDLEFLLKDDAANKSRYK